MLLFHPTHNDRWVWAELQQPPALADMLVQIDDDLPGLLPQIGRLIGRYEKIAREADEQGIDITDHEEVKKLSLKMRSSFFLSPLYQSFLKCRWRRLYGELLQTQGILLEKNRDKIKMLLEGASDGDEKRMLEFALTYIAKGDELSRLHWMVPSGRY